jgi:hypothetical protein
MMIRICSDHDFEEVLEIINDAVKSLQRRDTYRLLARALHVARTTPMGNR